MAGPPQVMGMHQHHQSPWEPEMGFLVGSRVQPPRTMGAIGAVKCWDRASLGCVNSHTHTHTHTHTDAISLALEAANL